MKRQKFSESQILKILKEFESGLSVQELGRKYGFYPSTLYDWRKKYAGITGWELENLQIENQQLKKMYANLSLETEALKDLIEKSFNACFKNRSCEIS